MDPAYDVVETHDLIDLISNGTVISVHGIIHDGIHVLDFHSVLNRGIC